jgi:hypothetical protein
MWIHAPQVTNTNATLHLGHTIYNHHPSGPGGYL